MVAAGKRASAGHGYSYGSALAAGKAVGLVSIPAGIIEMWGGGAAPSDWLLCDGSAVSRTTYADLFAALGTTYGVGDGSTTFGLPDFASKFPRGNTADAGAGSDSHAHGGGTQSITTGITGNQTNVRADQVDVAVVQDLTDLGHAHGINSSTTVPAYTGVKFVIKT